MAKPLVIAVNVDKFDRTSHFPEKRLSKSASVEPRSREWTHTVPNTHEDRVMYGRIGGYTRAAMYDSTEMTAPARRAFDQRFERQVDPDGVLSPAERAKRAEAARKAYFHALAAKSAVARRRAREATETAEAAERELQEMGGDAA